MDAKKLSRIMPTMVGIGFCIVAGAKLWAVSGAAAAPDPASGRTEPSMFAAAVSTHWSYITHTQMLVLSAVTGAVLLLAALMAGLIFYERLFGDADNDADPDAPMPPPAKRRGRAFGIRDRGI